MIDVTIDGVRLSVFTHGPARPARGLLLLFHGNSANPDALRDFAVPLSNRCGLAIAAPLMDKDRFPPRLYQRGNITDARGRVRPPEKWTTRLVPLLLDRLRPAGDMPYYLWGFSAGAQFLSRVAAFQDLPVPPQQIVIVSPSSHVQPRTGRYPQGEAAPYGMGGVFAPEIERDMLARYLSRPVTLCVGAEDRERTDPTLTSSRAARRQGADRLARAAKTFDQGAMAALRLRVPFDWQFKVAPGVGHSARDMLIPARAVQIIGLMDPMAQGAAVQSSRSSRMS